MIKAQVLLSILIFFTLIAGCKQPQNQRSPPGYDLTQPVIYKMPSILDEISGITFLNGKPDTIYTEQDEEGKLFYLHPGDKDVRQTKFGKRGDYEDVSICNGYVILLRSDGVLFTFPLNQIYNKEVEAMTSQQALLPEGEYESLYADERGNDLYTVCKNCSSDKSSEEISGHILHIDTGGKLTIKRNFLIDIKQIAGTKTVKGFRFKASALAQNKKSKEWFIISSVNKMLLVTDDQWRPVHTYPLNPVLFTQPEGIAFDRDDNLYISNEMGNGQNGTILKFLFNKN